MRSTPLWRRQGREHHGEHSATHTSLFSLLSTTNPQHHASQQVAWDSAFGTATEDRRDVLLVAGDHSPREISQESRTAVLLVLLLLPHTASDAATAIMVMRRRLRLLLQLLLLTTPLEPAVVVVVTSTTTTTTATTTIAIVTAAAAVPAGVQPAAKGVGVGGSF